MAQLVSVLNDPSAEISNQVVDKLYKILLTYPLEDLKWHDLKCSISSDIRKRVALVTSSREFFTLKLLNISVEVFIKLLYFHDKDSENDVKSSNGIICSLTFPCQ